MKLEAESDVSGVQSAATRFVGESLVLYSDFGLWTLDFGLWTLDFGLVRPMPFSSLIGNDRIKKLLQRAVAEGRVGQSLLMAGPRGVGKFQFALALAQALNCDKVRNGDACGECVPCRKIERREHGDVRILIRESSDPSIKKDSKSRIIKIEQTRAMSEQAQFRPYEGRRRVFIIDEAEWLGPQAANSLLKTLEEPPSSSLVVLVTSKPYALIETIRSRCLMLSFAPLGAKELEEHLRTKGNRPVDELRLLARLARGSIGRALEIDLVKHREMRNTMLELVETLSSTRDDSKLLGASEYLGRKLEKDAFEEHLETLTVLLDDLFHLKLNGSEESVTNADIAERLRQLAERVTIEELTEWADRIEQIFRGLPRNVNRQLAMDAMLITA
jgi:DNA polymerase III subunit delta'